MILGDISIATNIFIVTGYLTMVEMAKAYNLNLYEYLKYVLEQRPNKEMSDVQLEKNAPWNGHVQEICGIKKAEIN